MFHWTLQPQALEGFLFVHAEGANVREDMTVFLFAVDKFGNVKTDFPATTDVRVSHTGTKGTITQAGKVGVFINGNPTLADTVLRLTDGAVRFTLMDTQVENFRLRATDGDQERVALAPRSSISARPAPSPPCASR